MEIEKLICSYTKPIEEGNFSPPENCALCGAHPDFFKFYDKRKRKLRLLNSNLVKVILTFLLRWRCPLCQGKFTDYPPFIEPHKRFAVPHMIKPCVRYLTDVKQSYADAAKAEDGGDICYPDDNNLCEQFFAKSTVWRFMEYLAGLKRPHLFPTVTISATKTPPIAPSKYRSKNRLSLLQQAFAAIRALYQAYPDFETVRPPI